MNIKSKISETLFKISSLALILALITSCRNNPKVIEAEVSQVASPFEFSDVPEDHKISFEAESHANPSGSFHKVIVKEVLPTTKYVYLKVSENEDIYWLATSKMEVEVGSTYYYRNGLLKTNFESKEHQRTFDKLYLVSSIVPEKHGNSSQKKDIEMHAFEGNNQMAKKSDTNTDAMTIAELVSNKAELAGKRITLKGKCTKVNAKIMGRNWIHLKDGSMDEYDLVITSNEQIPVGHEVTMVGTVSIDKDFGSGYYYELLVENGNTVAN